MEGLERIKEESRAHGLCRDYSERWDSCRSLREMIDLACGPDGLMFLAKCCTDGYGPSEGWIADNFRGFINGRYTSVLHGGGGTFTSRLYCSHEGDIAVDTTLCGVIGCRGTVHVARNNICRIYADASSELVIDCPHGAVAIVMSPLGTMPVHGEGTVRFMDLK